MVVESTTQLQRQRPPSFRIGTTIAMVFRSGCPPPLDVRERHLVPLHRSRPAGFQ
jgi:hypothetical protein